MPLDLVSLLTEALKFRGFRYFISYNPVSGSRVINPVGQLDGASFFSERLKLKLDKDRMEANLGETAEIIQRIVELRDCRVAVFLEFASRFAARVDNLSEQEHQFFSSMQMLSHASLPVSTGVGTEPLYNGIFWFCEKENDLPPWLSLGNPRVRTIAIARPDHVVRRAFVRTLMPSVQGWAELQ